MPCKARTLQPSSAIANADISADNVLIYRQAESSEYTEHHRRKTNSPARHGGYNLYRINSESFA